MKILVVDDDYEIVELLSIYLRHEGYEIVTAFDGQAALEAIYANEDIDLVILDVMMPKRDGISVVKQLRDIRAELPVLMLSAKSSDNDKIDGLTSGADDYVVKPFNPLEVMARIKSLLRRSSQQQRVLSEEVIEVGPIIIKKQSHQVETLTGKLIQLTAIQFGILTLLASHPNRVFSAEEIFERVWQQESIDSTKTVMVHVSHLRAKIKEATGGDEVIQTVWGIGYKVSDLSVMEERNV